MNLVTISTVLGLGVLAACGRAPDEALVSSYGDPAPAAASPSEARAGAPAPESAASKATDVSPPVAPVVAAAEPELEDEKPESGALAFSPTRPDADPAEKPNAQVASLPKQDEADVPEPGAEEAAVPPTQDEEPASEPGDEKIAALPKADEDPEPASESRTQVITAPPKQDEEPSSESGDGEIAALPKQDADPEAAVEPATEEVAALPKAETQDLEQAFGIQLAAYRQVSGAEGVWNELLRAHPDLLAGFSKTIRRADLGATRGVVHQLRIGPFDGEAEARALCETLKKRGSDCFIVAP